ncbi:glycosyltransferase family 2 protein [Phytohabitans sp. ZYX-F-186]|uniref:Glycosyltransferase family 2 protein n=1 Tax=Phytohabitans maris TaxID=3071409 RepID=A0ABU0ZVD8_9ACTN|nr:glycosyltransferase family 2 protein [Phytohabitans sp. ZYX-F-186]MDQ7910999.1 glycosyltransferase family 2 protein [Phytohabitans sp. ZYX-F-186]
MLNTVFQHSATASYLVGLAFSVYLLAVIVPYLRQRRGEKGEPERYHWHFFVPCDQDEGKVRFTITALRRDFPEAHVWVLDDAGVTPTATVVHQLALLDPRVHLILHTPSLHGPRGGNEPFNSLYQALDRWLPSDVDRHLVVVAVVHPGVRLREDCLAMVSGRRYLGDPRVTVVQIGERIVNRGDRNPLAARRATTGRLHQAWARLLVRLQDVQSQGPTLAARLAVPRGGAVGFNGNGQFVRVSGLDALGGGARRPWRIPGHDYDLAVHLLIRGHRTVYAHDTWGERAGPPTLGPLLARQIRHARNSLRRARYLPSLWRNPALRPPETASTALILVRPWLGAVASLVYGLPVLALLAAVALRPREAIGEVPAAIWFFWSAIVLLGLLQFAVWGPLYVLKVEPGSHPLQAAGWGLAYVGYLFLSCLATWLAIALVLSGVDRGYRRPAQIHRTAGGHDGGPDRATLHSGEGATVSRR